MSEKHANFIVNDQKGTRRRRAPARRARPDGRRRTTRHRPRVRDRVPRRLGGLAVGGLTDRGTDRRSAPRHRQACGRPAPDRRPPWRPLGRARRVGRLGHGHRHRTRRCGRLRPPGPHRPRRQLVVAAGRPSARRSTRVSLRRPGGARRGGPGHDRGRGRPAGRRRPGAGRRHRPARPVRGGRHGPGRARRGGLGLHGLRGRRVRAGDGQGPVQADVSRPGPAGRRLAGGRRAALGRGSSRRRRRAGGVRRRAPPTHGSWSSRPGSAARWG